jgi:hypothetical protein
MDQIAYLLDRAYQAILDGDTEDALGFVAEAKAIAEGDEGSFDGQPDEAQEWHDFDPDC